MPFTAEQRSNIQLVALHAGLNDAVGRILARDNYSTVNKVIGAFALAPGDCMYVGVTFAGTSTETFADQPRLKVAGVAGSTLYTIEVDVQPNLETLDYSITARKLTTVIDWQVVTNTSLTWLTEHLDDELLDLGLTLKFDDGTAFVVEPDHYNPADSTQGLVSAALAVLARP